MWLKIRARDDYDLYFLLSLVVLFFSFSKKYYKINIIAKKNYWFFFSLASNINFTYILFNINIILHNQIYSSLYVWCLHQNICIKHVIIPYIILLCIFIYIYININANFSRVLSSSLVLVICSHLLYVEFASTPVQYIYLQNKIIKNREKKKKEKQSGIFFLQRNPRIQIVGLLIIENCNNQVKSTYVYWKFQLWPFCRYIYREFIRSGSYFQVYDIWCRESAKLAASTGKSPV